MLLCAWNEFFLQLFLVEKLKLMYFGVMRTHSIVLLSLGELLITQLSQLNSKHLQRNPTLNVTLELITIQKPFKDVRTKCQLSIAVQFFFFLKKKAILPLTQSLASYIEGCNIPRRSLCS